MEGTNAHWLKGESEGIREQELAEYITFMFFFSLQINPTKREMGCFFFFGIIMELEVRIGGEVLLRFSNVFFFTMNMYYFCNKLNK